MRTKSELERYLDGMVVSLRIQAAKRPDEWISWGCVVLVGAAAAYVGLLAAIVVLIAGLVLQVWLAKRRFGVQNSSQLFANSLEEKAPSYIRRELRKGAFDGQVGPEARAILESSATSANAIIATSTGAYMIDGGGKAALVAFRPICKSTEDLMKAALHATARVTLYRQPPNEDLISELREIDSNLKTLNTEASRIATELRSPSTLSVEAAAAVDAIKAREELNIAVDRD